MFLKLNLSECAGCAREAVLFYLSQIHIRWTVILQLACVILTLTCLCACVITIQIRTDSLVTYECVLACISSGINLLRQSGIPDSAARKEFDTAFAGPPYVLARGGSIDEASSQHVSSRA